MGKYALNTSVSTDKSINEIRAVLKKYGATGFAFGESNQAIQVGFELRGRRVRFRVPMPTAESVKNQIDLNVRNQYTRGLSNNEVVKRTIEKATPQLYRALLLVIKAKLESVESGIESFDQAFMAHLLLPSGETISEWWAPQADQIYSGKRMPPMLGSGE